MGERQVGEPVLIVEDEEDIARLLSFNLREAGFQTEVAASGEAALLAAPRLHPGVVVLDVMLPGLSGTEICRQLRASPDLADVGILIVSARGEEADRLVGFELGADDYVVKPFSVKEVVFRVRALARRTGERRQAASERDSGKRLIWRGLSVDPTRHKVEADGVPIVLRPIEFKLIHLFLSHPGQVFGRSDLLDEIWGGEGEISPRTIDTHVRRLREALGTYQDAVETVHGFGYRLRDA